MFDMDALAARVIARRGDDCRDDSGTYRVSREARDWHNRRLALIKAGACETSPEVKSLMRDRKAMIRRGVNV